MIDLTMNLISEEGIYFEPFIGFYLDFLPFSTGDDDAGWY